MAGNLLIRGGMVVTDSGLRKLDFRVADGIIVEMWDNLETHVSGGDGGAWRSDSDGTRKHVLDASGLTIYPGLIDTHVHFNEPGRTHWEGIASGSAALAAGGGTAFVDMPLNSDPPLLNRAAFNAKLQAAQQKSRTDFGFYGGLTPDSLNAMAELGECGVLGFKAFMCPSGIDEFQHADEETLLRGMEIAAGLGLPVLVHAESPGVLNALAHMSASAPTGTPTQPDSIRRFLDSRPPAAEHEAIRTAVRIAKETGCRTHIVHVSNAECVSMIRETANPLLSCETCPHYLFFNEHELYRSGSHAKCAPPLRDETTRTALVAAVLRGDIDTIGSDHSPCPPEMKNGHSFTDAWGGIAGAQTTLRTLITLDIPAELIANLCADRPARLLNLTNKGRLEPGYDADFCLVDQTCGDPSPITGEELLYRHRLSPYMGHALQARVTATFLRGERITPKTRGRLLLPASLRES